MLMSFAEKGRIGMSINDINWRETISLKSQPHKIGQHERNLRGTTRSWILCLLKTSDKGGYPPTLE